MKIRQSRIFFQELSEGHPPAIDCFSKRDLKNYAEWFMDGLWGEENKYRGPALRFCEDFNRYCEEKNNPTRLLLVDTTIFGSTTTSEYLSSGDDDGSSTIFTFKYTSDRFSEVLYMSINPVDFYFKYTDEDV